MAHKHFVRGQSVFKCATCGRGTRLTTQAYGSRLCGECEELAMAENSVLDGAKIEEIALYRDQAFARIVKLGGDPAKVRENFSTLWPSET